MFDIEDYNYELRRELIAQTPVSKRDHSRLLLLDRGKESISDHHFYDLPDLLKPGDLIVVNNTRVVPARIYGRKKSGGKVELLVLEHQDRGSHRSDIRWCLLKSSKRPSKGSQLFFEEDITGIVEELEEGGLTRIRFHGTSSLNTLMEKKGYMPLPPYIKRNGYDLSTMDRERYQTVFSINKGAVAAPTAGLHFTKEAIENLNKSGVSLVQLTLHVGHGTFRPVRTKDIRRHNLGEESYILEENAAIAINNAKKENRRVIAVGTTVVRTLESIAGENGKIVSKKGRTDLLITPGFRFRVIDGMITNFHLPKSSLLFLVSAFGGHEFIKEAYRWAIEKEYRFYSYGDAMLII